MLLLVRSQALAQINIQLYSPVENNHVDVNHKGLDQLDNLPKNMVYFSVNKKIVVQTPQTPQGTFHFTQFYTVHPLFLTMRSGFGECIAAL